MFAIKNRRPEGLENTMNDNLSLIAANATAAPNKAQFKTETQTQIKTQTETQIKTHANAKIYEQVTAKQTLTRVKEEHMPFEWSVNPYRGCTHGCSFCYARAFQAFIDKQAHDEFQNHILLKMNAAEALEKQLANNAARFDHDLDAAALHLGRVAIGTVTDPYQPIESKTRLTRECLKVLAKYRIKTSITTRSPLILRDLDLLGVMPSVLVNLSIGSLDAKLIRLLEPGAPLPFKRLEALEALTARGIRTGVFLAPILPLLTDSRESLEAVYQAAQQRGAAFVMPSLLRLSPDVKSWYYKTLQDHFPAKLPAYRKLFQGAYPSSVYRETVYRLTDLLDRQYPMAGGDAKNAEEASGGEDNGKKEMDRKVNGGEANGKKEIGRMVNGRGTNSEMVNGRGANVGEENVREENVEAGRVEAGCVAEGRLGAGRLGAGSAGEENIGGKNDGKKNNGKRNDGKKNVGGKNAEESMNGGLPAGAKPASCAPDAGLTLEQLTGGLPVEQLSFSF